RHRVPRRRSQSPSSAPYTRRRTRSRWPTSTSKPRTSTSSTRPASLSRSNPLAATLCPTMRRISYPAPDTEMHLPRSSFPELHAVAAEEEPLATSADSPLRLVSAGLAESPLPDTDSLRPLIEELLVELRAQRRQKSRVVVRTGGKVVFLRAEDIEWVEAAGNYV